MLKIVEYAEAEQEINDKNIWCLAINLSEETQNLVPIRCSVFADNDIVVNCGFDSFLFKRVSDKAIAALKNNKLKLLKIHNRDVYRSYWMSCK